MARVSVNAPARAIEISIMLNFMKKMHFEHVDRLQ